MGVNDYALSRDYQASMRLNFQHYTWVDTLGYILHPSIPTTKPGLSIAEVGTGTGIWLLDLHHRLPSPTAAHLTGLDISSDQFPCPEWLPSNTHLVGDVDALDPAGPPPDLLGKFDIVHIRLFLAVINNSDPSPVLQYCHKLLKPGGYLQWDDLIMHECRIANDRGGSTEGLDGIWRMLLTSGRRMDWVTRLPQTYGKCGFDVVGVESKVSLPWQRGMVTEIYCMVADEWGGPKAVGAERLSALASEEKRLGSYVDLMLQVVVGRKV